MATDFDSNAIVTAGGIKPSCVDTPTDIRTRVKLLEDIKTIPLPYIGMVVYCEETDKYYKITGLKAKQIGPTAIENAAVDTYKLHDLEHTADALSRMTEWNYQDNYSRINRIEDDVNDHINAMQSKISSMLSFNSKGELVVTINGVSKKFAPIPETNTPVQTNQIDFAKNIVFGYYVANNTSSSSTNYTNPTKISNIDFKDTDKVVVSVLPLEETTERISICPENFNNGLIPVGATYFVIIPALSSLTAKVSRLYTNNSDGTTSEDFWSFTESQRIWNSSGTTVIDQDVGCNNYITTISSVQVKVYGTHRHVEGSSYNDQDPISVYFQVRYKFD